MDRRFRILLSLRCFARRAQSSTRKWALRLWEATDDICPSFKLNWWAYSGRDTAIGLTRRPALGLAITAKPRGPFA